MSNPKSLYQISQAGATLTLQLLSCVNTARLTHLRQDVSYHTQLREQQALCETRGCPKSSAFENMSNTSLETRQKNPHFLQGDAMCFSHQGWFRFSELQISGNGFFIPCHFLIATGVLLIMASHHTPPFGQPLGK